VVLLDSDDGILQAADGLDAHLDLVAGLKRPMPPGVPVAMTSPGGAS
jgi:hypothetical protein